MHNPHSELISPPEWDAPSPQLHGGSQWHAPPPDRDFNVTRVPLTVLMWNVRGINGEKKQRYLNWLVGEQRPDVVMFNETKLTSMLYLDGYFSHQTLLKRSGGCITFSNLRNHRRVKALGTYLNWSKIPLGSEEVHILNVYLEPGHDSFVVKRASTVIALAKSIVRQDAAAKVIIGGDLNGQLQKVHTALVQAGFTPALREGVVTHR